MAAGFVNGTDGIVLGDLAGGGGRPVFLTGTGAEEYERAVRAMPPGFYTAADEAVLTTYAMSCQAEPSRLRSGRSECRP